MSSATLLSAPVQVDPERRRFTRDEFYRMAELGMFDGQRVELIEGEILEMAAQMNAHMAGITLVADALRAAFGPGFWVRVQGSLDLTPFSVPDPDLAVVPGSPRNPSRNNPTTALIIVEVSESSLKYDRTRKASLYARVGIADYWVLNLVEQQLEVYRNPVADPTQPYGFRFAEVVYLQATEAVSPLAAPHARIAVVDLLPSV
jgi:Uma2 family endonuclease